MSRPILELEFLAPFVELTPCWKHYSDLSNRLYKMAYLINIWLIFDGVLVLVLNVQIYIMK